LDQQLECASVPGFRTSNQRRIFLCNQTIGGRARRIRSANRVREFYRHIASPPLLAFNLFSVDRRRGLSQLNGNAESSSTFF
jgi:hypothetical protein